MVDNWKNEYYIFIIIGSVVLGLIIGGLFKFNFFKKDNNSNKKINTVLEKAKENGFWCSNNICNKTEVTKTNIEQNYTINIEEDYIECSFELYVDGIHTYYQSRYGYNNGVIISVEASDNSSIFNDYRANKKTENRTCNGQNDLTNCMFNISISNDLVDYYNNLMS